MKRNEVLMALEDVIEVIEFMEDKYREKYCKCTIGYECKLCRARTTLENNKSYRRTKRRPVICITTNERFPSVATASKMYDIATTGILKACVDSKKCAGRLNGEKLYWMFDENA